VFTSARILVRVEGVALENAFVRAPDFSLAIGGELMLADGMAA